MERFLLKMFFYFQCGMALLTFILGLIITYNVLFNNNFINNLIYGGF